MHFLLLQFSQTFLCVFFSVFHAESNILYFDDFAKFSNDKIYNKILS